MTVQRVEKHFISENNPYYLMLDEFCSKSKNLYNFANYHVRYNKSRRIFRGLFKSDKGILINADVNGSL